MCIIEQWPITIANENRLQLLNVDVICTYIHRFHITLSRCVWESCHSLLSDCSKHANFDAHLNDEQINVWRIYFMFRRQWWNNIQLTREKIYIAFGHRLLRLSWNGMVVQSSCDYIYCQLHIFRTIYDVDVMGVICMSLRLKSVEYYFNIYSVQLFHSNLNRADVQKQSTFPNLIAIHKIILFS